MFNRVVIKLSGEYLAGDMPHIDYAAVDVIVDDIIKAQKSGVQTALVIGGGNFWRGRDVISGFSRAYADYMGMLASVMNGVLLSERFAQKSVKAHVMTPFTIGGMTLIYNTAQASSYLDKGHTVIFAGGTGQPFFSTDTITVIRALELNADMALFAKDVPGVCDRDPRGLPPESVLVYREITAARMIENNLTVVDIAAMIIARDNKQPCALFDISKAGAIITACSGYEGILSIGTVISHE